MQIFLKESPIKEDSLLYMLGIAYQILNELGRILYLS